MTEAITIEARLPVSLMRMIFGGFEMMMNAWSAFSKIGIRFTSERAPNY